MESLIAAGACARGRRLFIGARDALLVRAVLAEAPHRRRYGDRVAARTRFGRVGRRIDHWIDGGHVAEFADGDSARQMKCAHAIER